MDVSKLLKNVNNLNDYISITQDVVTKFSNSKIHFNMSTILALNKIRSIEIEYFNKCDENGAALKILELILRSPPSKTWGLLGKELVLLMQYWLDALRKHLIVHNNHWWNFLSILLKFVQDICSKNPVLNDVLVQETAECLLDIATRDQPDVVQRQKIIKCLNKFCAESSREVRFALRNKFEVYLLMSSCGDLRTQFSIMETLLRWLLPRHDLAVRKDASIKWFPSKLFCSKAIDIFLTRPWKNFLKDARDFLNAHNEASDVITSVLCRKFSVGKIVLISGTEKEYWVDFNKGSKCISLMMESKLLEILGNPMSLSDVLIISEDNTCSVEMRGNSEVQIAVTVSDPQRMYPSNVLDGCDVTISISTRSDVRRVDGALRSIFDNKYQLLRNSENPLQLSPRRRQAVSRKADNTSEDEPRFSHPGEMPRRKRLGSITGKGPKKPISWQSPSTASTSSLAMLREKLTAFPGYRFDKEPVRVYALPQLSSVTEVSETDERTVLNASLSTLKLRPYGVCDNNTSNKKSQSDTETVKDKAKNKCVLPVVNNGVGSTSCLLVASIGSANDSVINDTLEPKDKDIHMDDIVDMLAREALSSTRNIEDKTDSSFLTSDKVVQNHNKNNKKNIPLNTSKKSSKNNNPTIVNNSTTTDESNTDVIEDTPYTINIKNKKLNKDTRIQQTYDNQAVEEFFSQHFIENRDGGIVISPTLAKKINESSSESIEFDLCPTMNNEEQLFDIEIIDCLNEIIDTVCKDFQKCSEYSNDVEINNTNNLNNKEVLQTVINEKVTSKNNSQNKRNRKATKSIKLKFANTKKQAKTRERKKNKLDTENTKRMSPIIEIDSIIEDIDVTKNTEVPKQDDSDTPLIKRKRKLYSPKDDQVVNEKTGVHVSETEEDTILPNIKINESTPKPLATPYKEIEDLRRRSIYKLRDRKSRSVPSLSPRTKKMNDMFDSLKKPTESEKVKIATRKTSSRQYEVYNFTSDSDDDDFKIKRYTKNITRNTSKTNVSTKPTLRRRSNTKLNYSENNYDSTEEQSKKKPKPKYVRQRAKKTDRKTKIVKPKSEMIDERMRDAAPKSLNTSLIIEQNDEVIKVPEPEPTLIEPQMEIIADEDVQMPKKKRSNRSKDLPLNKTKPKQSKTVLEINSDRDNTESPLPGLIIETVQEKKDTDESLSGLILENFKNIDKEGTLPDTSGLNNTQNLMSDLDHNNSSPSKGNVIDEFIKEIENQQCSVTPVKKVTTKKARKRAKITKMKSERKDCLQTESIINISESNIDILNISDSLELNSEKTIATIGKSPITGHGDFDELPPSAKHLTESVKSRGLETQHLNQSMKVFYDELRNEINEVSNDSTDSNNKSVKKKKCLEKSSTTNSTKNAFENSPTVSIQRLSAKEISRWLPPRHNSVFGSIQSSDSDTSTRKTRSYTKKIRINESISDKKSTERQKAYKSIISPVKMYGELNEREKSISSEGDDYVERIKSLITTKKELYKPSTSGARAKYDVQKHSRNSSESRISKISDVKEIEKTVKRKSSPVLEVKKLRKIDDNSIESLTIESVPSSSVQDWLRRNQRDKLISTAESFDLSLKDNLENIIEKLDTTLVEIHHKTSKKFVSMFVDTEKYLNELKDQRHEMFKSTAKEVMSEVLKVMNDKFESFDRRSQELDEQFMANIKEKARNLVQEDCKQKLLMVTLLKEDIQNVIENMKKG